MPFSKWVQALVAAAALLVALPDWAPQAQAASSMPRLAELEPTRLLLDQVEASLRREGLPLRVLAELARTIGSVRDQLGARIDELDPQLAEVDQRLRQLGPAPPRDGPPESPEIAAERQQLMQSYREIDTALRQARLLALRADQLAERIAERRRSLFAEQLFERSPSLLDPFFWREAGKIFASTARNLGYALSDWWAFALGHGGPPRIAAGALVLALFAAAAYTVVRWLRRRLAARTPAATPLGKVIASLTASARAALTVPVIAVGIFEVIKSFGLMPPRIEEIAGGLAVGIAVATFARAVAVGVLAPDEAARRLVALDDRRAQTLHRHFTWSGRFLGGAVALHAAFRALAAPTTGAIAINMVLAIVIAATILHLLFRLRADVADGEVPSHMLGLRALGWVVAVGISIALLLGYASLAYFIAERVVTSIAVVGAIYLMIVTSDALFAQAFTADSQRGRAIAANMGLNPRRVGLVGALLSGIVRLLLGVLALVLILGPWEGSTADLLEAIQGFTFAFRIGEITISFRAILAAAALLVVLLLLTRVVQRWLQTQLLPQTALDPGLRHSISTIVGYIGVITAITLVLAQLGIDLQKVALIAGALSVGIGFGLQSIVSNFVSGLILLAERPIRVGDTIEVKGDEGYVRRISVRSTEIETYDRASVIVPNSELITGVVKNWTHANLSRRIIIKVGVAYGSDPRKVQEILTACAAEHPQILKVPPPRAFLLNFGDSALEFELRCVVEHVDAALSARSDLNLAILARLNAAGIAIPFPQREVRVLPEQAAKPRGQQLPDTPSQH
jgi:small-conductance mechanosensitive channel